jgi:integrase
MISDRRRKPNTKGCFDCISWAAPRPTATVAEIGAAVNAATERFRLAIMLAAWCQLRRGEVLGLRRGDVDLVHSTVSIERTVTEPSGALVVGPPKTDAGRRKVVMPPNVVNAMVVQLDQFGRTRQGSTVI